MGDGGAGVEEVAAVGKAVRRDVDDAHDARPRQIQPAERRPRAGQCAQPAVERLGDGAPPLPPPGHDLRQRGEGAFDARASRPPVLPNDQFGHREGEPPPGQRHRRPFGPGGDGHQPNGTQIDADALLPGPRAKGCERTGGGFGCGRHGASSADGWSADEKHKAAEIRRSKAASLSPAHAQKGSCGIAPRPISKKEKNLYECTRQAGIIPTDEPEGKAMLLKLRFSLKFRKTASGWQVRFAVEYLS